MNKKTEKKIQIADAAAERYLENSKFSIKSLATKLEIPASEIYDLFPNRRSILEFYYEGALIKCYEITSAIDGYKSFSLSEKLSNLALTLIDIFQENREFVAKTYKPIIACSNRRTAFEVKLKDQIHQIFKNDTNQSKLSSFLHRDYANTLILYHFHGLIRFWMCDESEHYQKTMELVDKWTSFAEEIAYSSILDKGFELAKFAVYNSPIKDIADNLSNMNKKYE